MSGPTSSRLDRSKIKGVLDDAAAVTSCRRNGSLRRRKVPPPGVATVLPRCERPTSRPRSHHPPRMNAAELGHPLWVTFSTPTAVTIDVMPADDVTASAADLP